MSSSAAPPLARRIVLRFARAGMSGDLWRDYIHIHFECAYECAQKDWVFPFVAGVRRRDVTADAACFNVHNVQWPGLRQKQKVGARPSRPPHWYGAF
jgi:hypothetical protein